MPGLVMRVTCFVVLALCMVAHADPTPQQKVAITAKPSVVRVWGAYVATYQIGGEKIQQAIGGTGTGWFMTPDGYIATNAHVISDIHDGDEAAKKALYQMLLKEMDRAYGKEIARMSKAQIEQLLDAIKLVDFEKRAYVVLPNGDKLDYEIKSYGKPGSGRDAAIIKVKTENAPSLPIADSKKVTVADQIVVIGYPGVADMKVLLDEKSQLQASVTDGAISSLKRATSGEQILQISAPITHGNSGGPAMNMKGEVVGLATFGNESEIQGFNFLVASATLKDMIKDAKIEPKESETIKAWRRGLDHFWKDEFTAAINAFQEVEVLFPQHDEAPSFIRQSNVAKKEGREKKVESDNTGAIVGGIVGGVVVLGLLGFVVTRKKKPAQAQQHVPPGHPMHPPQQPQMYGRVPPQQQHVPIAKTVAITPAGGMAIGSLWCVRGQLHGQRFPLPPTGVIVGRQPGVANVLINDHRASGKHVWIGVDNGRLVAIDQGTTNGTYVNDVMRGRITRQELRDGDTVIISEPDCLSLQIRLGQ